MIGILDTGVGGLAVVRRIRQLLPDVDIVYLGDNVRGPMAGRNPQAAAAFVQEGQRFLTTRGAGLIVLACPFEAPPPSPQVADPPRFDLAAPAAEAAARLSRQGRIGVIGTPAASGGAFELRIRALCPEARVYVHPTPLLEALIETGWLNKPETARILGKYLHPLKVR
ncbi:MAG: glutamate racemase, partial [Desulfobacterales bacterium]|nr:glutamate racemase [Desulfobacterales bacterium]